MRPLLHFTPPKNWLNDPNGLVYFQGEYHLFYQHHPHSLDWGPMHWGHALSRDLLRWEPLPPALEPDEQGQIFSGSAAVDWQNSAGFGPQALVALFTHHREPGHHEAQSLAFSLDCGRSWHKYPLNPVLPNPGLRDFRDPKIFWHNDCWNLCLAAGREICFYTSPNLKQWKRAGVFAPPGLPRASVLETPDLFQLPVNGSGAKRWILTLGISDGAPAGGSGSRYFIGDFDGCAFTPASADWLDYGPDFYAPQTWSDAPAGRRILLGWMSNWLYARQTPATDWRGMFSLPRELTLVETPGGPRLAQQPIAELQAWRREISVSGGKTLPPGEYPLHQGQASACEALAEILPGAATRFGFKIQTGADEATFIFYDRQTNTLNLNRARSGQVNFHPAFAASHAAPLPGGERIALRILFDYNALEVFAQDGLLVLSACIFPAAPTAQWTFFVEGGALTLASLKFFQLSS